MPPMPNHSDGTALSYNGALVLQALLQEHRYGFEIMRVTQLKSGTVYPLLRRLEAGGFVQSRWESELEAHGEGRPARRYYEHTKAGERALGLAMERIRAQGRLFGQASV